MQKWKLKSGDNVIVLTGKNRGKSGKILSVIRAKSRVIVEGVNLVKRHLKRSPNHPDGAIISKEASIHVSNIAIKDPKTGQPSRVGYKILQDGTKVRISKRSGEQIDG